MFHVCFRKSLLVAFASLVSGAQTMCADNSLLSSVNGLGALNSIAYDAELRKKASISDDQLAEVKAILADKTLFAGTETENNLVGNKHLRKILKLDQLDRLRIAVVRKRIGDPTVFFTPICLKELGLEASESVDIRREFASLQSKVLAEGDKRRVVAIRQAFPGNSVEVVWTCVGREFIPDVKCSDLESIEAFLGLTAFNKISRAAYAEVPREFSITPNQRDQLSKLADELHRDAADGVNHSEAELESLLNSILSNSQRFAIVQSLNRSYVRSDLSYVASPHLAKLYGLSASELSEVRSKLTESERELKEWEETQRLELCRKIIQEVPIECRTTIRELSAGIWDF